MFGEDDPPPDQWPFGLLLAFGLHFLQLPLAFLLSTYLTLLFIGLGQLLYILPAIALCKFMQRDDLVKGLIIGASITFLLNTMCLASFKLGRS